MAGAKFKIYDGGFFRIATGAQYLSLPFVKKIDASFIYPYGVIGVGNPDNAQLNVSYARLFFVNGDTEDKEITSFLNVNGQLRLSNHLKLLGEVMYPMDAKDMKDMQYVWGIRFMTKSIGVDFGFWNSTDPKFHPGIPMISFSYNWK